MGELLTLKVFLAFVDFRFVNLKFVFGCLLLPARMLSEEWQLLA